MRPAGSSAAKAATAGSALVNTRRCNCFAALATSAASASRKRAAFGLPFASTPNNTTAVSGFELDWECRALWAIAESSLNQKGSRTGAQRLDLQGWFRIADRQTTRVTKGAAVWPSAGYSFQSQKAVFLLYYNHCGHVK